MYLNDCMDFIEFKKLYVGGLGMMEGDGEDGGVTVKATGGGAYKFLKTF